MMAHDTETYPNQDPVAKRKKFRLHEHPWLSMLALLLMSVVSIALSGTLIFGMLGLPDDQSGVQFAQGLTHLLLTGFIFAPLVLRLPKGKRTYRQYLDDVGFSRIQPLVKLVLLALSCYVILALSQAAASIVYRLTEGLPVTARFLRQVFDLSGDLPPKSASLLISFPSIFEEVVFRGVALTVFRQKFPVKQAIVFSSLGFGLVHLLNLAAGRELVWVVGQVVWAFAIGLFYGYAFVKTGSLWPSMLVHFLGNAFIGSFTGYLQARASVEMQALYGVIFSLGFVPAALMIAWTRLYTSKWLAIQGGGEVPSEVSAA